MDDYKKLNLPTNFTESIEKLEGTPEGEIIKQALAACNFAMENEGGDELLRNMLVSLIEDCDREQLFAYTIGWAIGLAAIKRAQFEMDAKAGKTDGSAK